MGLEELKGKKRKKKVKSGSDQSSEGERFKSCERELGFVVGPYEEADLVRARREAPKTTRVPVLMKTDCPF